jgi:hypothetical protein
VFRRFRYVVKDGVPGVTTVITLRNEGKSPVTIPMRDKWTGIARPNSSKGILWADAVDPADKAGYALAWVESHGAAVPGSSVKLEPGGSFTAARFLAVGTSPLEAFGFALEERDEPVEGVIRVTDGGGKPIPSAVVAVKVAEGKSLPGYADETGNVRFALAPGKYRYTVEDPGREPVEGELTVGRGGSPGGSVKLGPPSGVIFHITNEKDMVVPCKVQIRGIEGTQTPNLGPQNRAHGCVDQWHAEAKIFRVPLAPGDYEITVTRGIEHSSMRRIVKIGKGETMIYRGTIRRPVDTTGWVSTDFHNHSTPSGDNTCGTDDRLINLAAEHIEFAPTTEHNRLYDWAPHIEKLGLSAELKTVPGMELTGKGGHMNSFPFKPAPRTQDGGAPVWDPDPRVNAVHLREFQGGDRDRWVQMNHPRVEVEFFDRDGDGFDDGGYTYLTGMLDGMETGNYATAFKYGDGILAKAPYRIQSPPESMAPKIRMVREFAWLQMLNRGDRIWAVGVADAHSVYGNGVGGWRTYIPSSTDAPAEIDWREISRNARNGRMVLTTGPFLEVTAGEGVMPGGSLEASGKVDLKVRVQCTNWIDIDRVQVLVNGRQDASLNFTRKSHPEMFSDSVVKFEQTIGVPLKNDSHLIVVAIGEGFDLKMGYGTSRQAAMMPCAYNNPIFVDTDGNGFQPNGDMLGFPTPVQGMSVDRVRSLLEKKER